MILAISVCLAVAGCDPSGKYDGGKTPGGGSTPGGGGSTTTNIYDGSPHADAWYSGNYGDSIEGVWDSYVLPDFGYIASEYEAENGGMLDIEMASDEDMSLWFDMA